MPRTGAERPETTVPKQNGVLAGVAVEQDGPGALQQGVEGHLMKPCEGVEPSRLLL